MRRWFFVIFIILAPNAFSRDLLVDSFQKAEGFVPSRSEFSAPIQQILIRSWLEALCTLQSTRRHCNYMKDANHQIIFSPNNPNLVAWYEGNGNIYVTERIVRDMAERIADQGAEGKDIILLIAEKTVPVIAHEIRHIITIQDIKKITGEEFIAGTAESEVLSHWDEVKAIKESTMIWPKLQRYNFGRIETSNKAMIEAWNAGPIRFQDTVERVHDNFISMRQVTDNGFIEEMSDQARKFKADVASPSKSISSAELERRRIWAKSAERFFAEPIRVKLMRQYYDQEIKRMSQDQ